ncbi:phage major tail tube protein [Brevibacillus sp. HB1.1]|uniref:phage major tail tube protein n=1 Tax=Brevibacillus sp. HB1.1 TaxID=2738808 RepID=UPI0015758D8A|nr:phage major tail tube protein [Brevibacillus sp. HB1.1]NTU28850.1 phage major tail tube protein [Brevibacillus sp. HB1.1]
MPKQVSEKLISYRVYKDGKDFLGTADVTLPSLEYLTETVKGAGIAGEVDSPTIGNFGSMGLTLNWRTIEADAIRLAAPQAHALDFWGAQQVFDQSSGKYDSVAVKVSVRAIPKKFDIGKFEPGATTDSSSEFEVIYLKLSHNDRVLLEIDKYNYICVIDGVDYLAKVRSQLGY